MVKRQTTYNRQPACDQSCERLGFLWRLNLYGCNSPKLASAWFMLVLGAHASRVLLSASRRERFGWFGRDAQTDTRDACAPRTTDIGFLQCLGACPGVVLFGHLSVRIHGLLPRKLL